MTLLLLSELGTVVIFVCVQIEQLVFMQGEVITINREDFFRRQVLGIIEHPFNSKKKGKEAVWVISPTFLQKFKCENLK